MNNYLVWLSVGIGAGIGVILLIIISNHFVVYWREKRFESAKKEWELLLFKYLEGMISVEEVGFQMGDDYYLLWDFLKPYVKNLRGEDFNKLKKLVDSIGMTDFFLTKLKHGSKQDKVKAAVVLSKLKEKGAVTYLEEMLNSKSPEVVITAGRAIAEIGDVSLAFFILRSLFKRTYITFEGMSQLLANYGVEICEPIIEASEKMLTGEKNLEAEFGVPTYQVLSLFVDLLGYNRYHKAVELLERMLHQCQQEEVLIHIFKALARIQLPVEIDLTPFLDHDNCVIRSQATKFIATVFTGDYTEQLTELLADDNWWVRFYAGKALYNHGHQDLLQKIARSEDLKAKMSRYILESQ